MRELSIKYGCNPHQRPSRVYIKNGELPFSILNGNPSYINFADALNAWQLVKELKEARDFPQLPHLSMCPAGAAVANPLSDVLKKHIVLKVWIFRLLRQYAEQEEQTESLLCDFVAISDKVDMDTAELLSKEVSTELLHLIMKRISEILKCKKKADMS